MLNKEHQVKKKNISEKGNIAMDEQREKGLAYIVYNIKIREIKSGRKLRWHVSKWGKLKQWVREHV